MNIACIIIVHWPPKTIIHQCIEWGATDLQWALDLAEYANTPTEYSNAEKTEFFNAALLYGASEGYESVVRFAKRCGENYSIGLNYGEALLWAASRGHESSTRLCHKWAINEHITLDFENAMCWAASGGSESIMHLIYDWCRPRASLDMDSAMGAAAFRGRASIVRLCRGWGANDYNHGMRQAALAGHRSIVCLFLGWEQLILKGPGR